MRLKDWIQSIQEQQYLHCKSDERFYRGYNQVTKIINFLILLKIAGVLFSIIVTGISWFNIVISLLFIIFARFVHYGGRFVVYLWLINGLILLPSAISDLQYFDTLTLLLDILLVFQVAECLFLAGISIYLLLNSRTHYYFDEMHIIRIRMLNQQKK